MAAGGLTPPPDSWTVGIHTSEDGVEIIGTGVVIDATHVITAAHVVHSGQMWRDSLWISFPKAHGVPFGSGPAIARSMSVIASARAVVDSIQARWTL